MSLSATSRKARRPTAKRTVALGQYAEIKGGPTPPRWTYRLIFILLSGLIPFGSGCDKPAQSRPPQSRHHEPARPAPVPGSAESPRLVATTEVTETQANNVESKGPGAAFARGLVFKNDFVRNVPWSINLLKIDRSRTDFQLSTTLANGQSIGLAALSEQIEGLPSELGQPLAAINGDFYRIEQEPYAGDPRGLQIMRGELVSGPSKTSFWIDADGNPSLGTVAARFTITWPNGESTPFGLNEERHDNDAVLYTPRIGPSTRTSAGRELILARHGDSAWLPLRAGQTYAAEIRQVRQGGNSRLGGEGAVLSIGPLLVTRIPNLKVGEVIQISTATSPDVGGAQFAIGGGPVLVHEGKAQSAYANKSRERHPRTAIGWNDQDYFFVEVDGRQGGFSIGMTLPELAAYLVRQGCQEAMNLDGGGSAEMWVQGEIVNRPCFGNERRIGNGVVLLRKQTAAGLK